MSLPSDRGPHLIPINPASLGAPRGYSNGMLAPAGGRLLTIAGQIGWDQDQQLVSDDFHRQFAQALSNVVEVVRTAGGLAEDIAQLTLYVTDREEYLADLSGLGETYRMIMGNHYPTMALVEISALLEKGAKIEIQGLAVLAPEREAILESTESMPETATISEFPAAMANAEAIQSADPSEPTEKPS